MRRIFKILLLIALFVGFGKASAQNPDNPLLYGNQATMFGERGAPNDPVSIIMPGTAFNAGFGSYLDNPASMALFENSFFDLGLNYRSVDEEAAYLGQTRSLDDAQGSLSNVGFLYRYPTVRGSLVMGAGYSQRSVFNRALGFRAINENSTITDKFKVDGSPYQEIAYSTYATDFGDEFEDWDESIFRIGFDQFGDFFEIRQQGEIYQRGQTGEYSFFVATEFQENFMIGASFGLLSGRYHYDRVFQEIDEFNYYDSDIIDSGEGFTDIDNIVLEDRLRSNFTNVQFRAGILYAATDFLNIGASYELGSRINVDEQFDATIFSTFDNGVVFDDSEALDFSYRVNMPSKISLGIALKEWNNLSISFAADYVDYSNTTIDFNDSSLFEDEMIENDFIADNYTDVWSFRTGLAYDINPDFTLRAGYAHQPSRFLNGTNDRNSYSVGAGISITDNIRLELATQYTTWDEVSAVYDYAQYNYSPLPDNPPNITFQSEVADRVVDRLNMFGTLRFSF